MKKYFILLMLIVSFMFPAQFLESDGSETPIVGDFNIGTVYFTVNPVSNVFDYQNEPQNVINPYYPENSSFAIRLSGGDSSVQIKIKLEDSFINDFPNDGSDYLVGYNMVYPVTTANVEINESRGYLEKGTNKTICTITNTSGSDEDYYITIQWFFDLNKNKKVDAKVYDFTNAIEVTIL